MFNPRWDMHSLRAKEIKDSPISQAIPKIFVLLKMALSGSTLAQVNLNSPILTCLLQVCIVQIFQHFSEQFAVADHEFSRVPRIYLINKLKHAKIVPKLADAAYLEFILHCS